MPVKRNAARKNRKLSYLLFLIMMICAVQVLTACTASSVVPEASTDGKKESSTGTETNKEESKAIEKMRKIVILRPQYELGSVNAEEVKQVENRINKALLRRNSAYCVEIREIYARNYENAAEQALKAGEASIVFTNRTSLNFSDRALVKKGLAADLTDLLPGSRIAGLVPENMLQFGKFDGRNYSIPIYGEAALSYSLLMSKEFADGYHLSPDAEAFRAEDLLTLLQQLQPYLEDARNVDTVCPLFLGNSMIPAAYHDAIEFFDTENVPLFGLDRASLSAADVVRDEHYIDYLKLVARYREMGYIDPDFSSKPDGERTYAFWLKQKEAGEEYRYPDAYRIPLSSGTYLQESVQPRGAYVISASLDAQAKEDALNFIADLFSIKEIADLYTYGIPDQDYTIGEDGKVRVTADRNYGHSAWESTSVVPLTPRTIDPDFYAESCDEMNRSAEISGAAGFVFDPTPVKEAYDACIRLYRNEGIYLEHGSYGSADVKKALKTYTQDLEEAGYDEVRAEIDRQISAWLQKGGGSVK